MFNTRDRTTDERIAEPAVVVSDLMERLRIGGGQGTRLTSDDCRSHEIDLVDAQREGLRIEIVTTLGHARKEWWTFDKFERFLSGGFLAINGGETYAKWVENSRPRPPSKETVAALNRFCRELGFKWPILPLPSKTLGGDDIVDIQPDQIGSDWELQYVASDGDKTVHLWCLVGEDGTEAFVPTRGNVPKGRRGFADIHGLVTTMRYEHLQFLPPPKDAPSSSPMLR
ncbi:hypothetical protein OIU34_23695 [Pararhizobium sp. BT-229]|uniref:hypothetical protein n=1 Tax=Pararhizobium sp. BT-229 TaxID=2986923 RepID=UPI0021F77F3E|nr:hypothetical protein [Pararhizobium sp. BT-229]MCV9964901.1 hypothetical protein [Pararhizobium sp. BT-229]